MRGSWCSLAGMALAGLLATLPLPGHGATREDDLLLTAAEAERWILPMGSTPTLEVDALSSRITLRQRGSTRTLATALATSRICPEQEQQDGRLILHCRSPRLDARLVVVGGRRALDLRELRGLPWKEGLSGPPILAVDPQEAGLGGPCPGTTPAGKGECALAGGDRVAAAKHFAEEKEAVAFASLRLGDLALLSDRPARAAWHYQQVGGQGIFGRLAEARLCELLGHCLGTDQASVLFRTENLPTGLKAELALRAARVEAFVGDPSAAARFLLGRMSSSPVSRVCPEGQRVCEAIALAALRQPGARGKEDALALYFALPDRLFGPGSAALASAAAEVCAGLGAPVFGANLLAATTGTAASESIEGHLHQAANLYLQGGDRVRAGVILDYVRFRFGGGLLESPRWRRLVDHLGEDPRATLPSGVAALAAEAARDTELIRELAQALVAAAKARSLQAPTP